MGELLDGQQERDIAVLAGLAERSLATVVVSVTTVDPLIARKMEPRATAPKRRIETIDAHFSMKAAHVMKQIRETRGGKDHDPTLFLNDNG